MFDMFWGNSYIRTRSEGTLYLEESYETLRRLMNDSSSTITVRVFDPILGLFSDRKTFYKSDIADYGSN